MTSSADRQLSFSSARRMQLTPSHPVSLGPAVIFSCHLCLGVQTGQMTLVWSDQGDKTDWTCMSFFLWRCDPTPVMASSFLRFLDHTQQRTTVGRTPLDEWSARRRDLYLTTHNTHNRQISMPPVGFEPTISPGERPQTYAWPRGHWDRHSVFSLHWIIMVCDMWPFLYVSCI